MTEFAWYRARCALTPSTRAPSPSGRTLENRSPEVRPFPVVVFVLYGRDGRAVASRAFEPAEYLDGGAVPSAGLESGRRVDIAFDLITPSEVAVSFDLRLI